MSKACVTCGKSRPLDQFWRNAASKDGHRDDCISCGHKASSLGPGEHRRSVLISRWKKEGPWRELPDDEFITEYAQALRDGVTVSLAAFSRASELMTNGTSKEKHNGR